MTPEAVKALDGLIDKYEGTGTVTGHSVAWDLKDLRALAARGWTLEPEGLRTVGTICECGLAKSYHDGRLRAPEEYRPRYATPTPPTPTAAGLREALHDFLMSLPFRRRIEAGSGAYWHLVTDILEVVSEAAPTPPTPTAAGLDPLAWRPPTPKRVPMNVHPDAREAVHQLLMNDPRFHGVGYSQFVMWSAALARSGQEGTPQCNHFPGQRECDWCRYGRTEP